MRLISAITMLMLTTLSMANEVIIVTDDNGLPISGAEVMAMSYSINMKSIFTNYRGEAALKKSIQELKWVNIAKKEYETSHVQITGEWPLYVQLQKQKK